MEKFYNTSDILIPDLDIQILNDVTVFCTKFLARIAFLSRPYVCSAPVIPEDHHVWKRCFMVNQIKPHYKESIISNCVISSMYLYVDIAHRKDNMRTVRITSPCLVVSGANSVKKTAYFMHAIEKKAKMSYSF
jgi:hypothetical protein